MDPLADHGAAAVLEIVEPAKPDGIMPLDHGLSNGFAMPLFDVMRIVEHGEIAALARAAADVRRDPVPAGRRLVIVLFVLIVAQPHELAEMPLIPERRDHRPRAHGMLEARAAGKRRGQHAPARIARPEPARQADRPRRRLGKPRRNRDQDVLNLSECEGLRMVAERVEKESADERESRLDDRPDRPHVDAQAAAGLVGGAPFVVGQLCAPKIRHRRIRRRQSVRELPNQEVPRERRPRQ
jgi:hypothetical protein